MVNLFFVIRKLIGHNNVRHQLFSHYLFSLANSDLKSFTVYVVVSFPEVRVHMSQKAYNIHILYYKCMGLAMCTSILKQ